MEDWKPDSISISEEKQDYRHHPESTERNASQNNPLYHFHGFIPSVEVCLYSFGINATRIHPHSLTICKESVPLIFRFITHHHYSPPQEATSASNFQPQAGGELSSHRPCSSHPHLHLLLILIYAQRSCQAPTASKCMLCEGFSFRLQIIHSLLP